MSLKSDVVLSGFEYLAFKYGAIYVAIVGLLCSGIVTFVAVICLLYFLYEISPQEETVPEETEKVGDSGSESVQSEDIAGSASKKKNKHD